VTDASRTHLETIYAGVRATLLSVVHSYACIATRPSAPSELASDRGAVCSWTR
jgi:hypothetical protein